MVNQSKPPDSPQPGVSPADPMAEDSQAKDARPLDIVQLVHAYHAAVYRYSYRLTGSVADAEDLAQQVFLIAHQKLDQIREPEKADRWLMAVARSCFLKNQRRRVPAPAANLELNMDEVADPGPPGNEEVDQELLEQALAELSEPYRLVVVMYYFEDSSYKEIAHQLGIPIGTVMSRLARAKSHLRQHLAYGHTSTQRG